MTLVIWIVLGWLCCSALVGWLVGLILYRMVTEDGEDVRDGN